MKMRDILFQKSFDVLVNEYIEARQINTYHWSLKKISKKKKRSHHKYKFVIPRSYLQYTVAQYTDQEEKVYTNQFVPEASTFIRKMNDIFAIHDVSQNGKLIAHTRMVNVSNADHPDLVAIIEIKYSYGMFPYPIPPTELEIANRTIEKLNEKIVSMTINAEIGFAIYNECVDRSMAKLKDQIESKNNSICRMKDKLKEQYATSRSEDCPVCYDPIAKEKLTITDCCHYLCSSCSEKCTRCPLCRTEIQEEL